MQAARARRGRGILISSMEKLKGRPSREPITARCSTRTALIDERVEMTRVGNSIFAPLAVDYRAARVIPRCAKCALRRNCRIPCIKGRAAWSSSGGGIKIAFLGLMSMRPAAGGSAISTWRGRSIRFFATVNFLCPKSALKFHRAYLGRSALSDFAGKNKAR